MNSLKNWSVYLEYNCVLYTTYIHYAHIHAIHTILYTLNTYINNNKNTK